MKKTRTLFKLLLVLTLAVPSLLMAGASGGSGSTTVAKKLHSGWDKDTFVYRADNWELRITYRAKGTRSEGQEGVLLKDGVAVAPSTPGESFQTPFGTVKHYGAERKQLWDVTGWNLAPALPSTSLPKDKLGSSAAPNKAS